MLDIQEEGMILGEMVVFKRGNYFLQGLLVECYLLVVFLVTGVKNFFFLKWGVEGSWQYIIRFINLRIFLEFFYVDISKIKLRVLDFFFF